MNVGDKAPELLGVNEKGEEIRLSNYKGKKIVLYFYPKDSTSGCTAQACNLRDNYSELRQAGYEVIGVSVDSAKSHQKFIEKNALPFTLITDTDKKLVEEFGVWGEKSMYGRKYMGTFRTTFLINEEGVIERIIGPKEVKTKESDKIITVLSRELGVINIYVKGAMRLKNKFHSAVSLFAYSEFVVFRSRSSELYQLNEAEVKHVFHRLSENIEYLALAMYMSELVCEVSVPDDMNNEILRLFLIRCLSVMACSSVQVPSST